MRPARPSPTLPHQDKGRYTASNSWYASVFRLPRIPKNVWNGCTGTKVRITFSYIRSEGLNIAVEINYIKME